MVSVDLKDVAVFIREGVVKGAPCLPKMWTSSVGEVLPVQ